ncbi:MAG: hypothetical protein ACK2UR_21365 [Candidatus Promineifilaceae bacterium]|jgi:hypothetical protein
MYGSEDENSRLLDELWQLRQAIIRADPMVMHDGRFEKMFVAPVNIIDIARQLIDVLPRQPKR